MWNVEIEPKTRLINKMPVSYTNKDENNIFSLKEVISVLYVIQCVAEIPVFLLVPRAINPL